MPNCALFIVVGVNEDDVMLTRSSKFTPKWDHDGTSREVRFVLISVRSEGWGACLCVCCGKASRDCPEPIPVYLARVFLSFVRIARKVWRGNTRWQYGSINWTHPAFSVQSTRGHWSNFRRTTKLLSRFRLIWHSVVVAVFEFDLVLDTKSEEIAIPWILNVLYSLIRGNSRTVDWRTPYEFGIHFFHSEKTFLACRSVIGYWTVALA